MAIQITDAHRKKMIDQIYIGIINLQTSVPRNATIHKQWALDGMDLEELNNIIVDTLYSYDAIRVKLRKFRDEILPNDARILVVADLLGLPFDSLAPLAEEIVAHVDVFAGMPKTTSEEVIEACDYLIDNVNEPESVWG